MKTGRQLSRARARANVAARMKAERVELFAFANALRDFLGLDPIPEVGRVIGVRRARPTLERANVAKWLGATVAP